MNLWYISLPGDPAWWQAFAAIAQAFLGLMLFCHLEVRGINEAACEVTG